MTLKELLETAIARQWFAPSYRGPLQTYVKQYAALLGHEAHTCLPTIYHQPDAIIQSRFYESAEADRQPRTIQARINVIQKLLHRAVADGFLPALDQPPKRRRTNRIYKPTRYLTTHYPAQVRTDIPSASYTRYGLKDVPPNLAQEIEEYLQWCTPEIQRGRPFRIRKTASSQEQTRQVIRRVAGYTVTVEGIDPASLTLRLLCEPMRLENFAWWWLQRRGVSTVSLGHMLGTMKTIARHWHKDEGVATAIVGIFQRLDEEAQMQTVRDKESRMLSLETLDRLAQAYHPLHAQRLDDLKNQEYASFIVRHIADPARYHVPPSHLLRHGKRKGVSSFKYMALWFEMGFILRLLIHRPLRIGNIAALQFRHLQEQPGGGYDIVIPKAEMKNGKYMDRKEWRERFPTRLLPLLEEWLTIWRPRVLHQDKEDEQYVFLNTRGRPFEVQLLEVNFGLMTLRMTQDRPDGPVAWHPHLIRTTWTREMLNAELNAFVVRRIMGDSFKVIEKHYGGFEQERPSPFTLQLAKEIGQRID